MTTDIHDMTPVLIGAGQYKQDVPEDIRQSGSHVDMAARAAKAALNDAGIAPDAIDTVAAVRIFADSSPAYSSPFGRSENVPLSVANAIGATPQKLVYDSIGGQSPQGLVTEFAKELHMGTAKVVLITGGEALANVKAATKAQANLNWSDAPKLPEGCVFDDRGFGDVAGLIAPTEVTHGLLQPMMFYGLMETARRGTLGQSVEDYHADMAARLAPFSNVAEENPFAMFPERFSAAELARISPRNRQMTTPYLKHMVAKDSVNQGAAVILTTVGHAKTCGVDPAKWVFLHGAADATERTLLKRPALGESAAMEAALTGAIAAAHKTADDIAHFDIYSCFPIVVFNACDALGIAPNDPRTLTQTGGLPFFGGPGNNYTLHGLAAMVGTLRANPGDFGLVHGNGGWMSKHAVGVYSTAPIYGPWTPPDSLALQADIDARPEPATLDAPTGPARLESYIVIYARGEPLGALIIARHHESGARCYARSSNNSLTGLQPLIDGDVIGRWVNITSDASGNTFEFMTIN